MIFKRYTVRKFAIFAIVSLCSLVFAPHSNAQGNLQFNRVISFVAGSNYTVPTGKVLKIESINLSGTGVTVPMTSTTNLVNCPSICCGAYNLTVGVYASVNYLSIANYIFATPSVTGTCSWLSNPTPATTTATITPPTFQCPIWIESGKQVVIYSGAPSILISAVEFNIIP